MAIEKVIQSQQGTVKVMGKNASFHAQADSINVNMMVSINMQMNRVTKVVTVLNAQEIEGIEAYGVFETAITAALTELDATL